MLTDIDIHFLVGLLMMVHSTEGVSVELGKRVSDTASQTSRDVDIVVTDATGPQIQRRLFAGVEVKAHSRPLDCTHVEQLALKLSDMPDLTDRAVVSASGFTEPAIRKAAAHGLTPYVFEEWPDVALNFGDLAVARHCVFDLTETSVRWTRSGQVTFVPTETMPEELLSQFSDSLKITSPGHLAGLTLREFFRSLINGRPLEELARQAGLPDGETLVRRRFSLGDRPCVEISGRIIELGEIEITAVIRKEINTPKPLRRVLRNITTGEIYGGCAIAESCSGKLIGYMIGKGERAIRGVHDTIGGFHLT